MNFAVVLKVGLHTF